MDALAHFRTFLLAYIHTLLYLRKVYPSESFVTSKIYNTTVHQCRAPAVCRWIGEAVAAVYEGLHAAKVTCIVLVIYHQTPEDGATDANKEVDERYVLDVRKLLTEAEWQNVRQVEVAERDPLSPSSSIPAATERSYTPESTSPDEEETSPLDSDIPVDLSEQLKAVLSRLTECCREPLLYQSFVTVSMEMKDESASDSLVQASSQWLQAPTESVQAGASVDVVYESRAMRVVPIYTVDERPYFKTWVERW